ncbi:MAG: thiamine diphosphokinase [Anaerolineales bacterium]
MRIVIFSNGNFAHSEQDRRMIDPGDMLIAADGGLHHCLALNMTPDVLVGDLDSVEQELVADLRSRGTDIREHPARKDHTDLELALELAVSHAPDKILILGGLGGRWDQTLANILLLSQERFGGTQILLIDGPQRIQTVGAGETIEIRGQPGAIVSLIPIHGDATGITTQGLEYELSGGTLEHGSSRGVSNVLIHEEATVRLDGGMLVCIIIDELNSIPGT